jgi:hypothetical protein
MVALNVRNQRILGRVLLFVGKVEQQIETWKLGIPIDKRSALLVKQSNNFSDSRNELILQLVFLSAECDFRYPPFPLGSHLQSIAHCAQKTE